MSQSGRPDERWLEIWTLFHELLERPPGDRDALLDRAGDDDANLRREVQGLLAAHEEGSPILDEPWPVDPHPTDSEGETASDRDTPEPGAVVAGRFRIVRRIGAGGMGEVYEAERTDESVEQRVAIKLVRPGLDTGRLEELFLRERRILSRLDHPNVARFLDAGTTGDGRSYVVMEHVAGKPIDRYCREGGLGIDERLRLFCTVCDAVSYAHRNLVVHRDLKPSNILVTADGIPKLLDFGIAKLVAPDDVATRTHVMTPAYASPEQLRGRPVTTASDVYSLGVILYELLVGHSPYAAEGDTPFELAREVLEETPTRPSTAILEAKAPARPDSLSADPPTPESGAFDARRRSRRLRGDLDTIVLAALHKDPERRYESAEQLAADVRRHLAGLPVAARPDTFAYRLAKFVGRHRVGVVLGATTLLVLIGATAVTSVQSSRLSRALERADRDRVRAERVAGFLTEVFEAPAPRLARGREITARQILDNGALEIRRRLEDEPEVRAVLLDTLGTTYHGLGWYDEAESLLTEALALRREILPLGSPELARSHLHLGTLRYSQGRYQEAGLAFRAGLGMVQGRDETSELEIELAHGLGSSLIGTGEYPGAETLLRHAMARIAAVPAVAPELAVKVTTHLAYALFAQGDYGEAETLLVRAVDRGERELGADAPRTLSAQNTLAEVLYRRGALGRAERLYLEVLATRERVLGSRHKDVATTLNALGSVQHAAGKAEAAEGSYRRSLEISSELGPGNPFYAFALNNLAWLLHDRGEYEAALPLYEEALATNRSRLGEGHPELAVNLNNLGLVHHELGSLETAARYHREAESLTRSGLDEQHPRLAFHLTARAAVALDQGAVAEAERLYRDALALRRSILPEGHADLAETLTGLGALLVERGEERDLAEAEALLNEALEIRGQKLAEDHWLTAVTESVVGACLVRQGRVEEGQALLREAYPRIVARRGEDHRHSRQALRWLVES